MKKQNSSGTTKTKEEIRGSQAEEEIYNVLLKTISQQFKEEAREMEIALEDLNWSLIGVADRLLETIQKKLHKKSFKDERYKSLDFVGIVEEMEKIQNIDNPDRIDINKEITCIKAIVRLIKNNIEVINRLHNNA